MLRSITGEGAGAAAGPRPVSRLAKLQTWSENMLRISVRASSGFDGKLAGPIGVLHGLLSAQRPAATMPREVKELLTKICQEIVGMTSVLTEPIEVDGQQLVISELTKVAARAVCADALESIYGLTGHRMSVDDCRDALKARGVSRGHLLPLAATYTPPPSYHELDSAGWRNAQVDELQRRFDAGPRAGAGRDEDRKDDDDDHPDAAPAHAPAELPGYAEAVGDRVPIAHIVNAGLSEMQACLDLAKGRKLSLLRAENEINELKRQAERLGEAVAWVEPERLSELCDQCQVVSEAAVATVSNLRLFQTEHKYLKAMQDIGEKALELRGQLLGFAGLSSPRI